MNKTKSKFDLGIILRVTLFVILSSAVSTPLRIFVEAVIEGREEAPEFITVGFLIYAVAAKLVVGFGYIILGYKLPVKNTALRGFTYIMLIFFSSYLPNILGMIGGDGAIIEDSLSAGIVVVDALSYLLDGLILGLLMKRYDVPNPDTPVSTTKKQLLVACASHIRCDQRLLASLQYSESISGVRGLLLHCVYCLHVRCRASAATMESILPSG